jgi:putative ABC transport system permease protein
MFRYLPYVLKNLWRHRARTALTVSGAAVALFVYCVIGSVQAGLDRLSKDRQSQRTLIVFQANRFCPSTSRLPEHYGERIAKLPGVKQVIPIMVFMNNCRASLDLVLFHGVPTDKLRAAREMTLESGSWDEYERSQKSALVGRALARRRGLKPGQQFSIGEVSVTVAGIYSAPTPSEENFLYCHLEFLQRTPGLHAVGAVTQFEVHLNEDADADAISRQIDEMFKSGPAATDTRPKGVFEANAVGDLIELIGFAHYLGLACVGLVLALVATTTVMAVQDRVREHALLQTLGFSGPLIFRLVLAESVIVGLAGGVLGVAAAMIALWWGGLAVGTEGVSIAFTPTPWLALSGLFVSLVVGAAAGLVPAIQAARAEIVASLRAV